MSRRITPQSLGPKGSIIETPGLGIQFCTGATVPSDGASGYAVGGLFLKTDGGVGTALYVNEGTKTSADFNAIALPGTSLLGLLATAAEINLAADLSAMLPSVAPGVGITAGTGTVIKRSLTYDGELKRLSILIDLTGLGTSTTDLDVIGVAGGPAILGRILAAEVGTVLSVLMTCLETPATGADDIDLYSAAEGTAVFDDGIAALTETALITSGAAWTQGVQKAATTVPPPGDYLYLVNGEAATVGTFTAGKLLIEIYGY